MRPARQFPYCGELAIAFSILLAAYGCGGGSSTPPVLVSITPATASAPAGTTASLVATVVNATTNQMVTWTVSCSSPPCGSVSPASSGSGAPVTYTAPANAPASDLKVTVTASSAADSSSNASATVTVPAITISVSPATGTAQVNGSLQLTANVNSDPAGAGVTWSVSCATAPCGSVSPTSSLSGLQVMYSAPATPPTSNLAVTVTATSVTDKTKSATAALTVPSILVTILPGTATVQGGLSAPFTATLVGDSSNKGVNWTVSCAGAPCGSVSLASSTSGIPTTYTAPPVPSSDVMVTLTATSVANAQAVASAAITVPAISVSITPASATVIATTTQPFTPTVDNDPSNKGVTWALSCSTNSCGTLSTNTTASGVAVSYTAPALSPNDLSVTLTATSVADTTKSSSTAITVPAIVVKATSPLSGIIPVNATQQFITTVLNDPTNGGLNWSLAQNGTSCSPGCGSVSPATTPSATATTFTAPASLPATASVTLIATAVADSTKSVSATITLTSGTVKLIPASLSFSCKLRPRNFCPPPSQDIVLTNTGASALTINSITVTGGSTTLFLLTNDCASSVNGGASCSVVVTFKPVVVGTFRASLSFSDSSSDSPQQAGLAGAATSVQGPLSLRSELSTTIQATVPALSGPEVVGSRVIHFVDASRKDPYLANGAPRELSARLWYPAVLQANTKCAPAPYTSPQIWNYFASLADVRPFPVKTNSCWETPAAAGPHPVVVFSPGLTASFSDYTYLTEDLASRGYVVAAIAHTYETTAAELRDGRLAKSVVGSHLGGPAASGERSLAYLTDVRVADLRATVTELERMNSQDANFAGKLDLSRIAVAGHSLGALSALLELQFDPRFKAAVLLDSFVPSELPSATRKPVLLIGAGRDQWGSADCHLWNNLAGPRLAVNLSGTEHVAFGDWIWMTPNAIETGPMGPEKTLSAIRNYVSAFLDAHLRNIQVEPAREGLLNGASASYPDAQVVRQEQSLCGKP